LINQTILEKREKKRTRFQKMPSPDVYSRVFTKPKCTHMKKTRIKLRKRERERERIEGIYTCICLVYF